MRNRRLAGLVLAAWGLAVAGCQSAVPEQRTQERIERIRATTEGLARREQQGPKRIRHTWSKIEDLTRKDVRTTYENREKLRKRAEDDYWRWRNNEAEYRRIIRSSVQGDPERARNTAERIFY